MHSEMQYAIFFVMRSKDAFTISLRMWDERMQHVIQPGSNSFLDYSSDVETFFEQIGIHVGQNDYRKIEQK